MLVYGGIPPATTDCRMSMLSPLGLIHDLPTYHYTRLPRARETVASTPGRHSCMDPYPKIATTVHTTTWNTPAIIAASPVLPPPGATAKAATVRSDMQVAPEQQGLCCVYQAHRYSVLAHFPQMKHKCSSAWAGRPATD